VNFKERVGYVTKAENRETGLSRDKEAGSQEEPESA
jgi:hypothetical protein